MSSQLLSLMPPQPDSNAVNRATKPTKQSSEDVTIGNLNLNCCSVTAAALRVLLVLI